MRWSFGVTVGDLKVSPVGLVQLHVMPGVAFPPVGPVGLGSPPSSVLCSAKTATLPFSGRFACRSLPDTLPASVRSWCPPGARAVVEAPTARQGLWSPGLPIRTRPDGDTGQAQVLACCRGFHQGTRPLGTPRTDGSRPGNGKRAPSEATREGQDGSLSGAEYRRRWGTQAHGTHWREGDAGHHVELARPPGETLRSPTVTPTLQRIAAQAARDPARVFMTSPP